MISKYNSSTVSNDCFLISIDPTNISVPFLVKRIYFLHNLKSLSERGFHAHKNLHQVIICTQGSFQIKIDDGKINKTFKLDNIKFGLYLRPGLWRELFDFKPNTVCLVLASDIYSEIDYIRNYDEFLNFKSI